MEKVSISFGNHHLALSEARMQNLLDGKHTAVQDMGWFDSLTDSLFHNGAKKEALHVLVQEFQAASGLTAYEKFDKLASYANRADSSQFTIHFDGEKQTPQIEYRIKGHTIKQEKVTEQTANVISARMGLIFRQSEKDDHVVDWMHAHRLDNAELRAHLTSESFEAGGVHKRFHGGSGTLRAETAKGALDFQKEDALFRYAHGNEPRQDLARYLSTQREIHDDLPPGLDAKHGLAEVDIYDQTQVDSGELDTKIRDLSPHEARSVLIQLIDMTRVFYKNDVSHRDLHMHNLMIYKPKQQPGENITLKAIDFGNSQFGTKVTADKKLIDIRYLFHKESHAFGETTLRNVGDQTAAWRMKHYPLHKLMARCVSSANHSDHPISDQALASTQFDEAISKFGSELIARLQAAEEGPSDTRNLAIDYAFDIATDDLVAIMDRLIAPTFGHIAPQELA